MFRQCRFDDVAIITLGKRPRAPDIPETSTMVVRTPETIVAVRLAKRTIVAVDRAEYGGFVGKQFHELTRHLYAECGGNRFRIVSVTSTKPQPSQALNPGPSS